MNILDTKLDGLEIYIKTYNTLSKHGLHTVGDLLAQGRALPAGLRAYRGIGKATADEVAVVVSNLIRNALSPP